MERGTRGDEAPPAGRVREWAALVVFVAIMFAAGGVGGLATETGPGSWYAQLDQPAWNPPDWLFGPVWTLLYVLIGVATWLVWRAGLDRALVPLGLFTAQVALNAGWSVVFFAAQAPGLALAVIAALWVVIVAMIVTYRGWSRLAAGLLVPYLAWVSYATALNAAILSLN